MPRKHPATERVHFFACDVGREQQVRKAIEQTVRQFGPVTQLVNNAGVNAYFDAAAMSEHDWDSVFGVDPGRAPGSAASTRFRACSAPAAVRW